MFVRITVERADLWFLIRMIPRSLSFFEDLDLDIAEWLGNHPEAPLPSDLGRGWAPELLATRTSQRRRIGLNLTTPSIQQIGFEAHAHSLGQTDLATMALLVILITRKNGCFSLRSQIITNRIEPGVLLSRMRSVYRIFATTQSTDERADSLFRVRSSSFD